MEKIKVSEDFNNAVKKQETNGLVGIIAAGIVFAIFKLGGALLEVRQDIKTVEVPMKD